MIFTKLNRTDPEKIFVCVKAGEALLAGRPVCYHFSGTDDGKVGYLANAADDATLVIGCADKAIASGDYGLVQCYGFRSDAPLSNGSTIPVGGSGAILNVASALSGHFSLSVSRGAETAVNPMFVCAHSTSLATTASSDGTQTVGIFIRCM